MTIVQPSKNISIVKADVDSLNTSYEIVLNGKIYEANNSKKANNEYDTLNPNSFVYFGSSNIKNSTFDKLVQSKIVYGKNYEHCSFVQKDDFYVLDIVTLTESRSLNISFEDDYTFEKPLSISVPFIKQNYNNKNLRINLTTDFDKFAEKGIKYTDAFKLYGDYATLALTSLEDIRDNTQHLEGANDFALSLLDKTYYNNVCVCYADDFTRVNIDIEGPGKIYPNYLTDSNLQENYINYAKGSQTKFYYYSDDFSYMEHFKFSKINSKVFTAQNNINAKIEVPENVILDSAEAKNTQLGSKGSFLAGRADFSDNEIIDYVDTKTNSTQITLPENTQIITQLNARFISASSMDYSNIQFKD